MESLADSYNVTREPMQSFPEFLETAVDVLVEDNYTDYLRDILTERPESLLDALDEATLETELKRTMKNSILYMVLVRCGYDPAVYEDVLDFGFITMFDTPKWAYYIFYVMSGIAIGRGPSFVYDLWESVRKWGEKQEIPKAIDSPEE